MTRFRLPSSDRLDPAGPPPRDGTYLTDGRVLLRIVRTLTLADRRTEVEVEDCATLETSSWPGERLYRAGLRYVRPEQRVRYRRRDRVWLNPGAYFAGL